MGPWVYQGVCREIDGIERWGRDSAAFLTDSEGDATCVAADIPPDVRRWVWEPIAKRVGPALGRVVVRHLFARLSTEAQDATRRIHTDYGMGARYACVLYCGDVPASMDATETGTGFFRHATYGAYASGDLSATEHDRLSRDSAALATAWTRLWVCPMQRNQVVVYPAAAFHGRVPATGWGTSQRDGRLVMVGFFDQDER